MSQLGIGVMIDLFFNDLEPINLEGYLGMVIESIEIDPHDNGGDGSLTIMFEDGIGLKFFDSGRSCCESRYMSSDDNLPAFVGAEFMGTEPRNVESTNSYGEPHEMVFMVFFTSYGEFTVVTHNEHNGYYGGFSLQVETIGEEQTPPTFTPL